MTAPDVDEPTRSPGGRLGGSCMATDQKKIEPWLTKTMTVSFFGVASVWALPNFDGNLSLAVRRHSAGTEGERGRCESARKESRLTGICSRVHT